MQKKVLFLVLFVLMLGVFFSSDMDSPTGFFSVSADISNASSFPFTIINDSVLTENISVDLGAIVFGADNIVFDCQGFAIFWDRNGTGADAIVAVNRTNVSVKNCFLEDINASGAYGVGVNFTNTTFGLIQNNTIQTNGTTNNYGVFLVTSATDNLVTRNTIRTNGTGNTNYGISVSASARNNATYNNLPYVFGTGIYFESSSSNATIFGNNVTTSGTSNNIYGIYPNTGSYFVVANNTVRTNSTGNNNYGIVPTTVTHSLVANNTVFTYGGSGNYGIFVRVSTTNVTVENNNVSTDGTAGSNIGIQVEQSTQNCTVRNNFIQTNGAGSANRGMILYFGGGNHDVYNNIVYTNGTSTHNQGIGITQTTYGSRVYNNTFYTSGVSTNDCVRIQVTAHNQSVFNNSCKTSGNFSYGVSIATSMNNTIFGNVYNDTSQWYLLDSTSNGTFSNETLMTGFGSILFNATIGLNGTYNITRNEINVSRGVAFVNSSNLSAFNVSSVVTLSSLFAPTSSLLVDYSDNGSYAACSSCSLNSFVAGSGENGSLVFTVPGFTSYSYQLAGANVSLSKESSPDPVANGSELNYSIVFNVTGGFAFNITILENYSSNVTFVSASPAANSSNNTWIVGNLSSGQSFQINVTVNVSSTASGIVENIVNVSFNNASGANFSVGVVENTTVNSSAPSPSPSVSSGGGGGGGSSSVICPPICKNPAYSDMPVCRNCPVQKCVPSWSCSDWSYCDLGLQGRSCFDSNNCGSFEGRPSLQRACEFVMPVEEAPAVVEKPSSNYVPVQNYEPVKVQEPVNVSSKRSDVLSFVFLATLLGIGVLFYLALKDVHRKKK